MLHKTPLRGEPPPRRLVQMALALCAFPSAASQGVLPGRHAEASGLASGKAESTHRRSEMKAIAINPGEDAKLVDIEDTLEARQAAVGGLIEFVSIPLFEGLVLIVNEEGLVNGMMPNRAIYASKAMEQAGYLSQMDGRPVREGELYTILFGTILVMAETFDEDGFADGFRDVTADEFRLVADEFANAFSGFEEVMKVRLGLR